MLLIHLLLNSGSVECTFETFSSVSSEITFSIISFFQKTNKRGVTIRAGGGLENFSKVISGGMINRYSRVKLSHFILCSWHAVLMRRVLERPPQTF